MYVEVVASQSSVVFLRHTVHHDINRIEDTPIRYSVTMRTIQSWTCELDFGADTMFHRTYFLLFYVFSVFIQV